MSDHNLTTLIGRVSNEPTYTPFSQGGGVLKISVATERTWRDKATGEPRKKTQFNQVDVFGAIAEVAKEHIKVGTSITIVGELQTNSWGEGDDKKWRTSVVVESFEHLINWHNREQQS